MLQCLWQGILGQGKKLAQVARHAALGEIENESEQRRSVEVVDAALAAFGLAAVNGAGGELEDLYLWPDNVITWNLFQAVSTQWIVGAAGAVGLNYPGVEMVMRNWRISRNDAQRVFSEIQAMERATLIAWSESRK